VSSEIYQYLEPAPYFLGWEYHVVWKPIFALDGCDERGSQFRKKAAHTNLFITSLPFKSESKIRFVFVSDNHKEKPFFFFFFFFHNTNTQRVRFIDVCGVCVFYAFFQINFERSLQRERKKKHHEI
jgi:hypothetical protein